MEMANMDEVAGETALSLGPHSLTLLQDGTHRDTEELPNSILFMGLFMIYRNIIDTCKMFAY